ETFVLGLHGWISCPAVEAALAAVTPEWPRRWAIRDGRIAGSDGLRVPRSTIRRTSCGAAARDRGRSPVGTHPVPSRGGVQRSALPRVGDTGHTRRSQRTEATSYGRLVRPVAGAFTRQLTFPSGNAPSPISWWTSGISS